MTALNAARLCATGAVTLPRQRRRRWSWVEIVLNGIVIGAGAGLVAGVFL